MPEPAPSPRRRARSERGMSLLEVIISIGILGTVMISMMAGVALTARTTSLTRDRATQDSAVTAVTERLRSLPYVTCTSGPDPVRSSIGAEYDASSVPSPNGQTMTVTIDGVAFWSATAKRYQAACPPDGGAQLVNIKVLFGNPAAPLRTVKTSVAMRRSGP